MDAIHEAIIRAAVEAGEDPAFALAVAERESNFDPNAKASKTIRGLYQMSQDLRGRYNIGGSVDPYTQASGWMRFIGDTRRQMASRLGRDPTPSELYLGHYFGPGRASSMLNGWYPPNTDVRDVFTDEEIRGNPNIARAGTIGNLSNSITADMERRRQRFAGGGADYGLAGQALAMDPSKLPPWQGQWEDRRSPSDIRRDNHEPYDFSEFSSPQRQAPKQPSPFDRPAAPFDAPYQNDPKFNTWSPPVAAPVDSGNQK